MCENVCVYVFVYAFSCSYPQHMFYAVYSGTPMENTHNANGGRPEHNLIPKNTSPCEKQADCGSPTMSLFVHVHFKKLFLKRKETETFDTICLYFKEV